MNKILQLAHDSIHRHQGLALVTAVFVAQGDDCAQLLLQLRRGAEVAGLIMSLPRELAGHWQKKSEVTDMWRWRSFQDFIERTFTFGRNATRPDCCRTHTSFTTLRLLQSSRRSATLHSVAEECSAPNRVAFHCVVIATTCVERSSSSHAAKPLDSPMLWLLSECKTCSARQGVMCQHRENAKRWCSDPDPCSPTR